jgi:hypothetical protein
MRELIAAVLLSGLMAGAAVAQESSGDSEAQAAGEVRAQTEQVLRADDIQRDTPLAERVREEASKVVEDPALQHETPDPSPNEAPSPPPAMSKASSIPGDVFLYILVGILAVCLALALVHLLRTYRRRQPLERGDQPLDVAARPITAPQDAPAPELDEIEKLARAGAYAEAIHLMLLRALEALRRRLGTSWAKSLTSREITRQAELGANDRRALKVLVGAVEICRFGGQAANEQVYHACLDHYRQIGADGGAAAA